MHTRLAEVIDYADATRAELLAAVATIPPATALVRSADGGWSVRDVVEHLLLVEKSSLRALFRALRTAKEKGAAAETDSTSLAPVIADVERRLTSARRVAPEFTRPASDATVEALIDDLRQSRAGLHAWANEGDGIALGTISFPHPALGELALYGWVVMIGAHERHHTAQIRNIVASLGA